MMPKFLSWPIRVHLLILVILLALPSITLIIFWGVDARDQAIEDAKSECLKFVNAIASEQRAAVAGVQQLVAALALLPQVQSRNGPATDALLSDLLKKNALYSNIVISDPSGLLWASSTPYEGNISVAGRKYFRDAVGSGTFSSGEFSVGRIAKTPVMTFAQPVTNTSNKLSDVIAVALNLGYVQALFEKINLPAGSSFSLLDHRGVILHRNSQDAFSEQLVGKRDIREDLFTRMVEGPDEGTYEAIGNDDKERLVAYRKIRLPHESQPYLYIRSSIPRATVVSQANAVMFRNMAALASVFAVGLILALFIGKRMIVGPITKLKEASLQLAAGPGLVNIKGERKSAADGLEFHHRWLLCPGFRMAVCGDELHDRKALRSSGRRTQGQGDLETDKLTA
jgi:two-component system cell cycle sensor histidine kinase/response regulator CckA